jgi:penicillin-binding protein 1A
MMNIKDFVMKRIFLRKGKAPTIFRSRLDILKKGRTAKRVSLKKPRRLQLSRKMKKILLISTGVFFVAMILVGLRLFAYVQSLNDKLPNPDTVFAELPVASEIFDRNALNGEGQGQRLYRVFNRYNSDNFKIEEVPDSVKLAFMAAEDREFFEHGGFNPQAIFRCGINYIKDSSNPCGASTITQQLVKLTTDIRKTEETPKLQQKIEEILLASKVEQNFNKDQVLLMYLRATPFGSSIVGLKTAANFYFRKEPKDLTLDEAVMLAAIIQNPSYLSPTVPIDQDTDAAKERLQGRMDYIFKELEDNMGTLNGDLAKYYNDEGKKNTLTTELINEAKGQDWKSKLKPAVAVDLYAGHFVNYVMQELQEKNYKNGTEPFTVTELQTGGYRIYTTLDYNVQKIAETYAARGGNDYSYWNANNAALLTTTPSNGQIIAMAGSKSFTGESQGCDDRGCKFDPEVNVLTSIREPGSSNKPLGYYIGFKEGKFFPGSFLPDFPIKITDANGNFYEPRNWDGGFKGVSYTAGQALIDSRNIPAIEIVGSIGVQNYIDTAKSFGYTTYTGSYGEAVILGGVSVKPVEHAQAYGVFANGGDLVKLNPILKILDKEGKTVYEAQPERTAVGDPQGIFLLTETLKQVPGGNNISWDGREFAGKTGTTNNNEDAWFVGYTPDMVSLAWVGNNIKDPMDANHGYPYYVIGPWYSDYLREIGNYPYFAQRTSFPRPGNITQGGGGCNANGECVGLRGDWMISDRGAKVDNKRVKAFVCTDQPNNIARDIDKLVGKAVEKEFIRYIMPVEAWQEQLDNYFKSGGSFNGAPTEPCTIDRGGANGGPVLDITAPGDGATISNTFNVSGAAVSLDTDTLTSIQVTISGQAASCGAPAFPNFSINCSTSRDNGVYTLVVTATDSGGESTSISRNVTLNSNVSNNFNVVSTPPPSISLAATPCPCNIRVNYPAGGLSGVRLIQNKDGVESDMGGFSLGANYSWTPSGTGNYYFYVVATPSGGGSVRSVNFASVTVNP